MPLEPVAARWRSLDPWERAAWSGWALVLVVLAVRSLGWPNVHSVYPIFEQAAHHWVSGADMYILTGEDANKPVHDPYRYSPLVATLFVPLSVLPAGLANLLWRLVNLGALLGGLHWCGRNILARNWQRRHYALLFLAALPLAVDALYNGQSNVLVIGLTMLCLGAATSGFWLVAGVCGALACLFKVYPIAVGLLVVLFYPRRFGPRFVLALAAGLLLPFLLQRPEFVASQYASWLRHMGENDRHLLAMELWYRDLRLVCSLAGRELSYLEYQIVEAAAGAGIALFCLIGRRAGWSERILLMQILGLGACWMTAFGPATESSTYSLLAPVVAWLVVDAWRSRHRGHRSVVAAVYALLIVPHMFSWFPHSKFPIVMALQPLAALLTLVLLLGNGLRVLRRSEAAEAIGLPPARAA